MKQTPGETVKALRLARGMTQRELSERTGIAQSALSAIEHGAKSLGLARAVRIAEALGVRYADILGDRASSRSSASSPARVVKAPRLTAPRLTAQEKRILALSRNATKFLYGEDARKLLYGEHVPAHRWQKRRQS